MRKFVFIIICFSFCQSMNAQLAEVQTNYNSIGDVEFIAYNNTPAPLFLHLNLADVENAWFRESLPYIKKLDPGFNILFTLEHIPDMELPRFHYQIKVFRSNPVAKVDLDFPYLLPFAPGEKVKVFDVKNIDGFWGSDNPESWNATGFETQPGRTVYACRTGIVVEIAEDDRNTDPKTWYHAWNNSITVLQTDGTLACYRNVVDKQNILKVGEKVFAGEPLGFATPFASEVILLIFQHDLDTPGLRFIIPRFVVDRGKMEMLNPSGEYTVAHPPEIRGKEMSRREKRKYLH